MGRKPNGDKVKTAAERYAALPQAPPDSPAGASMRNGPIG